MAKELSEETSFNISLKTLAGIAVLIFTLVGMWFTLQNDIADAKELPLPPDPEITRMEYDMKIHYLYLRDKALNYPMNVTRSL